MSAPRQVFRLLQLRGKLDIFISHDWPQHIARSGDMQVRDRARDHARPQHAGHARRVAQALFRRKAFLQSEVADGSLGSPPARELLATLRPSYW